MLAGGIRDGCFPWLGGFFPECHFDTRGCDDVGCDGHNLWRAFSPLTGMTTTSEVFYYRTKNKLSNEIFVDLAAFFLEFSPFLSIWPLFFSNCLDFCRFWPEFEEKKRPNRQKSGSIIYFSFDNKKLHWKTSGRRAIYV